MVGFQSSDDSAAGLEDVVCAAFEPCCTDISIILSTLFISERVGYITETPLCIKQCVIIIVSDQEANATVS